MINIQNLSKKYKDVLILDNLNLQLPRYGIVAIVGPSGCGKTTLLNCLSSLCDYEGDIFVDNQYINHLNEKEMGDFRLKNYGFIFQDFKLYENETVERNVLFPLDVISNAKKYRKMRKCQDLLAVVGLENKSKQLVKKLSGGEKQRVSIARALINEPKIILADEPTGSLDSTNSQDIMAILEKISSKALVVVVSHDLELMKNYADKIIEMKDGKISNTSHVSKHQHEIFFPVCKNSETYKKPSIPFSFLFNHAFSSFKEKKWRNLICNAVTSLGLIGIGVAVSLSSSISTNIKKAYSSLMDNSKIMISLKDESPTQYGRYAGSKYEAISIAEKYHDQIKDVGITYQCNFETHFKDADSLYVSTSGVKTEIDGISSRSINEFRWLDLPHGNVYPNELKTLADDEVVFSLNIKMIEDICFALKIERSVSSLSNYLLEKTVPFYFDFANLDWQYDDQQLVSMKGFILSNDVAIYHLNHNWNEYMFETCMRFTTSDSLDTSDAFPWIIKKIYYFETYRKTDVFLQTASYSSDFESSILEIADTTYYPWMYRDVDITSRSRILFFARTIPSIPLRYSSYFQNTSKDISNSVFTSNGSYAAFPSALMMGFSKPIYFSLYNESLASAVNTLSSIKYENSEEINLPSDVACGHYSKNVAGGVIFRSLNGKVMKGRKPNNLDEIVISSKMAMSLFSNVSVLNHDLYLAYTARETVNSQGYIKRSFVYRTIKIVGIVDSDSMSIYHDSYWTIGFFQSRLGVSAFQLGVNTIAYDLVNSSKSQTTIKSLTKAFPYYDVVNPLEDINTGVDEICSYLQIALICFSLVALVISSLLLSISNYLHIFENRKDIGLARCIGINKKEARKFLYFHSGFSGLVSFMLAAVELLAFNIIMSLEMTSMLGVSSSFSFNPLALALMLLVALLISLVSVMIIGRSVSRLSPLEALKR